MKVYALSNAIKLQLDNSINDHNIKTSFVIVAEYKNNF